MADADHGTRIRSPSTGAPGERRAVLRDGPPAGRGAAGVDRLAGRPAARLRRRGVRDPELVAGDGARGRWRALAEVFPAARHQRRWVHKTRNISNPLPTRGRREGHR
ncbi:transposase [Streptomyces sp. NPDC006711]|uniref:transposase n=1 Tax=Streptomyces sp. NPDC006711 TaxID=3364762 RepID=UPI0036C81791